jgi:DNA-binding protein HU-beta
MATDTKQRRTDQVRIDATTPLYAVVGVTDLAVELARNAALDVSTRLSKVDLEPKVLGKQARKAQAMFEARVTDLQGEAKALPDRLGEVMQETVTEVTETYGDLAARGRDLVARVRRQESTKQARTAAKNTVSRVKSTRTATAKSAKASVSETRSAAKDAAVTATSSAKRTAGTVKRNAKGTTTSAKKAASATAKATTDAAAKVGD